LAIRNIWKKNKAEIIALLSGKMPNFIYGANKFKDIPVFCLHSARYPDTERQLAFLTSAGFNTLNADEFSERLQDKNYKNNGKDIVLTYDDGLSSVWTIAYPLLKKYNHKIISFILPGLIEESQQTSKNLDDCESEEERIQMTLRDCSESPLCNWAEIREMHDSGLVDFQSHGMLHRMVSTSPRILDFIHPEFDLSNYGNTHLPEYMSVNGPTREAILGHPVYEHAPLLGRSSRYNDAATIREQCAEFVREKGEEVFFNSVDWREQLSEFANDKLDLVGRNQQYISLQDDIVYEMVESKKIIDQKLNKNVSHFCFPWFVASKGSVEAAYQAGYEYMHLGAVPGFSGASVSGKPELVTRLQEEYLLALPGYRNLYSALKFKINRQANW